MDKRVIYYMYENETCAEIWSDYTKPEDAHKRLLQGPAAYVKNHTESIVKKPFGVKENVTYNDFENLLATRCFPKSRANARQLLRDADIEFYNPLQIVSKTHGVMSDDLFWIRFEGEEPELWNSLKL